MFISRYYNAALQMAMAYVCVCVCVVFFTGNSKVMLLENEVFVGEWREGLIGVEGWAGAEVRVQKITRLPTSSCSKS